MLFSAETVTLLLYVLQQLGVMLAVGSQTIVLVDYLSSIRDGVVEPAEERLTRAVKHVLFVGALLVLVSGVAISIIEYIQGRQAVVLAPAYLFKAALVVLLFCMLRFTRGMTLPEGLLLGFTGGTWYAVFIIHILAPAVGWQELLVIYAIWIVGFALAWAGVVFLVKDSKRPEPAQFARPAITTRPVFANPFRPPVPPPPPAPAKPVAAQMPPVAIKPLATVAPTASAPTPPPSPKLPPKDAIIKTPDPLDMPSIQVMPRTEADMQKDSRAAYIAQK